VSAKYWKVVTNNAVNDMVLSELYLTGMFCPAGSYASSTSTCTSCPTGKYIPIEGKFACKSCEAGTYASAIGSTSCTPCASGLFSAVVGAVAS
jgi:hypothetical protein